MCLYLIIGVVCVGAAVVIEWATTPGPTSRNIHIEMFRYGASPSIIRANRGDELTFTFSSRDTGHSFFLQDHRIEAKVSPAQEYIQVYDPLNATDPPVMQKSLRIVGGLQGLWGRIVSLSRFRCHVYCGRMHGFEQGDIIVRPNWLFSGSMGLLLTIVVIGLLRVRWDLPTGEMQLSMIDLNKKVPLLDRILKWRPLQFLCTLPIMAAFVIVIMAGFFGTKVGGRNLGVMLTWSVWMSLLTLVLVPVFGRVWCFLCPLPSIGEYLQRQATVMVRPAEQKGRYNNRFFGLGLRWPRALRGPWIRMLIYLSLGTLSASMAGQPKWTATALSALCITAIFVSLIFELRAFCMYVCPVGTFISCYSSLGRLMVRSRDRQVCSDCKVRTCLRGNEKGWACPYRLCVANIDTNFDCGLCMECFKSCSYDNVSLGWRRGPSYENLKSYGQAWQVMVMLVLGMVYPLTILSPWPAMRDMVNVVDKVTWAQFGVYALTLWTITLAVIPLVFWLATALGMRLSGVNGGNTKKQGIFSAATGSVFKKAVKALIPLGLSFWATFFIATVMVNMTFILMSISDPFGHGWNLIGMASAPWVQIWPSGIPWLQTDVVFLGYIYSLKKGYGIWLEQSGDAKKAIRGFMPLAGLITILATGMIVYFTNF